MIPIVYDQLNGFGKNDQFFLDLLETLPVRTIADLGCGTGRLTAHFIDKGYQVTGIEPNEEALSYAKQKQFGDGVQWILGDSSQLNDHTYDAVVLTANVAQVFLTDESWENMLQDVVRALKKGGHLLFDARNPESKVWEQWEQDDTPDFAVNELTGEPLEIWTSYDGFENEVYTFCETVKGTQTGEMYVREKIQLRFRSHEVLQQSLQKAGFATVQSYGDFTFEEATVQSSSFIFHAVK
ncbi:class I SAM-dependent methyltransferase [Shouchella sp. 1P09AA]|uniref:class I SAM-dependent methyltransferase n=1 Tax=unclassified Shouchella TaxID=2893065 RepID=UPI0039A13B90